MTDQHDTDRPASLTRRRFVQTGSAATAALYLGGLTGTASAAGTGGAPAHLVRSTYAGLEGTPFTAARATGPAAVLRLTAVADLVRASHEAAFRGREDAFALTFDGPRDAVLAGGIHELDHPSLGTFSVFIAPVGAAARSQVYEVVVDRSVRYGQATQVAPQPLEQANAAPSAPAAPAQPATTPGSAPVKAKAKAKTAPRRPTKLLLGAVVARRAGVINADVRVAAGAGVMSVRATLLRDGVEVARGAKLLRGKAGVRLDLRELRPVGAGTYDLRLTVTDRKGKRHVSSRRVTLR